MNNEERRKADMLARVCEYGTNHPEVFPASSRYAALLASVTAALEEITVHETAQQSGANVAGEGNANRAATRVRLRTAIDTLRRTAAALADDLPGIDRRFQVPKSESDRALLTTARVFAGHALAYRTQLAELMLGDNFFSAMAADAAALEAALAIQTRGRDARAAATAALKTSIKRAVRSVSILTTLMRNQYGHQPEMLAAWRAASKVHSSKTRGPGVETSETVVEDVDSPRPQLAPVENVA